MRRHLLGAALVVLLGHVPGFAQQTSGNIMGRVLDPQASAVPGVTITAKNPSTGFERVEVSDAEGAYRLTALPIGAYDLTAELQGFATIERRSIVVNVSTTMILPAFR